MKLAASIGGLILLAACDGANPPRQHVGPPPDPNFTLLVSNADLSETFTVDDRQWGVVMFWFYPAGSPEPTPPQFSWSLHDEQPAFD
jgi:hypothetical protein